MGRLREKLTFANVMSVVAVFIALGGTAIAVTKLPKDSVGAKQIKPGAVRSPEVKDFSLLADDFAKGTLLKGDKGEQGPAGQPGTPGVPGTPATQIYAFVRTGDCCGGAKPPLDPPKLVNAHGVTAASLAGTGQYEVTFDTGLLPGGSVNKCVPIASEGSQDAAYPLAGYISVTHPGGIPQDKLLVLFRDKTGALAHLNTGGGSDGFSIALFC
jgi:hypothetical protein